MERSADAGRGFVACDEPVYGVTTGFGSLADTVIPPERTGRAAGRAGALARRRHGRPGRGRGGAGDAAAAGPQPGDGAARAPGPSSSTCSWPCSTPASRRWCASTARWAPAATWRPLAHCALALIGEGEVWDRDGRLGPTAEALAAAGLAPVTLRAKEGLALINGTDGILGMLCSRSHDLDDLVRLRRRRRGDDGRGAARHRPGLRRRPAGAAAAARARPPARANLRRLLAGSAIVASHRHGDSRVQDAYSLRCTPQVHGAALDTLAHARTVAERELDAAIDNPMILPDGRVESCGNFHGAPLGFACDFLAIATAEVGAIAERRTDRLLDATRSHGLPPFLSTDAGVNSGLMIAHYTQAAMAMENQRLAVPASVDSLPTSAMQEDHVSMGWARPASCAARSTTCARIARRRAGVRRRRARSAGPARAGAGTGAALAVLRDAGWPAPGPTAGCRPTCSPPSRLAGSLLAAVGCSAAVEAVTARPDLEVRGGSSMSRSPTGAGTPRHRPDVPRVAPGSGLPDAAQQPRPGGGRAARRPRRLRRHRAGGPLLGRRSTPCARRSPRSPTTRRCSCSPASRSACSAPTSGRRGCCSPTPTSCPSGRTWDEFRRLEALGLTMYGQMTAGSWIYIGTQGILQGTYECFAEIARRSSAARWPARSRSPPGSAAWAARSRWRSR